MNKRSLLVLGIATLTLASTAAIASLYAWNDAKRPPVTLQDALSRAEKLLGDDAGNRYCVSVSLYGDATGEGKEGAWNLLYAAADGSKKHVYVDMRGRGHVSPWNGPIDPQKVAGRRTDLADVCRRLEQLFAQEGVNAKFEVHDGALVVKYNVREFQIYPQHDDGSYADQLQAVPGPAADGIWLKARVVDQPDRREYGFDDGPYWRWDRGTYFLAEPGKFLAIDLRYGAKAKGEVVEQMQGIFGKSTSRN